MPDDRNDLIDNFTDSSAWLRILFMIGFALALYLVIVPIVLVLIVAQGLFALFAGAPNPNLRQFGKALTLYISAILEFLTYNREQMPFPFSDFPTADETDAQNGDQELSVSGLLQKPKAKDSSQESGHGGHTGAHRK